MTKTRQDNNVTDHTRVAYTENEIKLSWPIGPHEVCDKDQIGKRYNQFTHVTYVENEIEHS